MVLDTVPADRMLIVETAHLAERDPRSLGSSGLVTSTSGAHT